MNTSDGFFKGFHISSFISGGGEGFIIKIQLKKINRIKLKGIEIILLKVYSPPKGIRYFIQRRKWK